MRHTTNDKKKRRNIGFAFGGLLLGFLLVFIFFFPLFGDKSLYDNWFISEKSTSYNPVAVNEPEPYVYTYPPMHSFGAGVLKEVNWSYFKQLFNAHTSWLLEYKRYSGSSWTNGNQYLTVNKSWNESGFWKIGLTLSVPVDVYTARFTFGCDLSVLDYVERDGYEVFLNYTVPGTVEVYNVMFNWSDIASIPNLVITHGKTNNLFWFRFQKDNIPAGSYYFDPTFGYTGAAGLATIYYSTTGTEYMRGTFFGAPSNGIADNITIKTSSTWGLGIDVQCALYAYVSDTNVGSLIAVTNTIGCTGSTTYVFNFSDPKPSVTSGVNYFLFYRCAGDYAGGTTDALLGKSSSATATLYKTGTGGVTFDDPLTGETTATVQAYIVCSYTESGYTGTIHEKYITGSDAWSVIYGSSWAGQTFTVGNVGTNETHTLTYLKLYLSHLGSPGTLYVNIYATNASGYPIGTVLSSGTIDGNTLTSSLFAINMSAYDLQLGIKYAIVLNSSGTVSDYATGYYDSTSSSYLGGTTIFSNNSGLSNWSSSATSDFYFEVYGIAGGSAWSNHVPIISSQNPANASTGEGLNHQISCLVSDADGNATTVNWYSNVSGSWVLYQTNSSVTANTSVYWDENVFNTGNTKYWWNCTADDGNTGGNVSSWNYYTTVANYTKTYQSTLWWNMSFGNSTFIWQQPLNWNMSFSNSTFRWQQPLNFNFSFSNNTFYWHPPLGWNMSFSNSSFIWKQTAVGWNMSFSNSSTIGWTDTLGWNMSFGNSSVIGWTPVLWWNMSFSNTSYSASLGFNFSFSNTSYTASLGWNMSFSNSTIDLITISLIYPGNNSINIPLQPYLIVNITNLNGELMNISWYYGLSAGDENILLHTYSNNTNGSTDELLYAAYNRSTHYYWRVMVNDGTNYVNESFVFRTEGYNIAFTSKPGGVGIIGILGVFGLIGLIGVAFLLSRRNRYEE